MKTNDLVKTTYWKFPLRGRQCSETTATVQKQPGRNIVVKTAAGKLEGVLKDANDESCSVETTETVKVEGKKKKEIKTTKFNTWILLKPKN